MIEVPTLYIARNKALKQQVIEFIKLQFEDDVEPDDLPAQNYIGSCVQHAVEKHGGDWEPVLVLRLPEGATVDKPDKIMGCYFAEVLA